MKVASDAATICAQFARTGNPAVEGLTPWPAYTAENNTYLDIGTPLAVKNNIESAFIAPPPAAIPLP